MDLAAFANKLGADMMRAQAAGSPRETKMDDAYDWIPPADDRAAADELQAERYERSCEAIWHAMMYGLPDDLARHLANECGVQWADVQAYVPAIQRSKRQEPLPL